MIDLFGTTGLHIVGTKVLSMSLEQAKEFYGFLEGVFVTKLQDRVKQTFKDRLSNAFSFDILEEEYSQMAAVIRAMLVMKCTKSFVI